MCESINWENIIPNFQKGDIVAPFENTFQEQEKADFILDGGMEHRSILRTYASVRRKDTQKEGVYSQSGEQILPEDFDQCNVIIYNSGDFYVATIEARNGKLYGLYNRLGQQIVPVQFLSVQIQDYMVIVRNEDRLYGAYSLNGKEIISCNYDVISFSGSLDQGCGSAIVRKNSMYGVISESGEQIVPLQYGPIFRNAQNGKGYIIHDAKNHKLCGWYSSDGKNSIPCQFEKLKFYSDKIQVTIPNLLHGIYSYVGKELVPPIFKEIHYLGNYIVGLIGKDDLSIYDQNGNFLYNTVKK